VRYYGIMLRRLTVLVVVGGLCGVVAAGTLHARQDFTRTEADTMLRKLSAIMTRGTQPKPSASAKPVRTSFTDREVNAFFQFNSAIMPTGVVEPRVTIVDGKQVRARALVDLDAIRKSKERTWLDPLTYATGRVELRASGLLSAANGKGLFQLQSATLGGVPIPASVVQEVVNYYTRTPENPQGFDLTKPFDLPQNIKQVELQPGAATIIQ
jgi:hypothetical protein